MGKVGDIGREPRSVPVCAYGLEPGAAQRLDPNKRIWYEQAPTLRAKAGDNQVSVVVCRRGDNESY